MADERDNQIHERKLQLLENFSNKLEKFTILTIILLPNYTPSCATSFIFSTILYLYILQTRTKLGLVIKSSKLEQYFKGEFWIERFFMILLVLRDCYRWGVFSWALAVAFFGYCYLIQLSKQGNLVQKVLMSPSLTNHRVENGYRLWFERILVVTLAGPIYYLAKYGFAVVVFILLHAVIYAFYIGNNYTHGSFNHSRDAKKLSNKKIKKNNESPRLSSDSSPQPEFASLDEHLFWFERVAIFCSIVCSSRRELVFAISNGIYMLTSVMRTNAIPFDYMFWIERAATIFLLAYGFYGSTFIWSLATSLFALTNTVYSIDPLKNLLKNLLPSCKECFISEEFSRIDDDDIKESKAEELEKLRAEIKSLIPENNGLKIEKILLAQKLDVATKLNDELLKKVDVLAERLDAERAEQIRDFEEAMAASNEIHWANIIKHQELLSKAETKCKELRTKLEEAASEIKVLRAEAELFVSASLSDHAMVVETKKRIDKTEEEKRQLEANLEEATEALEHFKDELERVKERSAGIEARHRRCIDQLLVCQGRVSELAKEVEYRESWTEVLSEEYRKVEERCEIYKSLLHDKDL